jgi:hypothetical protein
MLVYVDEARLDIVEWVRSHMNKHRCNKHRRRVGHLQHHVAEAIASRDCSGCFPLELNDLFVLLANFGCEVRLAQGLPKAAPAARIAPPKMKKAGRNCQIRVLDIAGFIGY